MNEQLAAIIDLLKTAIENGQTITLSADDVTITPGPNGPQVVINAPSVSTEG